MISAHGVWRCWLLVVPLVSLGMGCRSSDSDRRRIPALGDSNIADAAPFTSTPSAAAIPGNASIPTSATGVAAPAAFAVSEALPSEERERDPASETVTIVVQVEPPKRAHVFWGPKDLGVAPLEIKRPRGSGPLDLVLRAPGYLSLHTRAFTDRDDRLVVRLVPETDAPRMLGYRPR